MFLKIGRKEITTFFYIYMMLTMTSLILDSGVIPPASGAYPYFTAVQNGFTSALCVCLLVNGFVGFQLYEDGTRQSVWLLRGSSIGMFMISGAVSILTFKEKLGLGPTNTLGLFVVLYLINGICLLIYVVMQVILVTNTLQDRWPLGDIGFGVFFFVIGQVILYVFSDTICDRIQHYLSGLFFATICNLLAVMMIYKVCFEVCGESQYRVYLTFGSSTGIRSQKKTSNSASGPNKVIGRSKNFSLRMIDEARATTTVRIRNMPAACSITNPAIPTMAALIYEVFFKRHRLCPFPCTHSMSMSMSIISGPRSLNLTYPAVLKIVGNAHRRFSDFFLGFRGLREKRFFLIIAFWIMVSVLENAYHEQYHTLMTFDQVPLPLL